MRPEKPNSSEIDWDETAELFNRLIEMSEDERAAWLERLDPTLSERLERLMRAHRESAGFLEPMDPEALASLVDEPSEDVPGTIGRYRVIREIGRGGMGVVYLGEDESLRRKAALKFLPAHLVRDDAARARFIREARAASALDSPHIGTIYGVEDVGDGSGRLCMAMAYYDGPTLDSLIAEGPLDADRAVRITMQIADGLRSAHAADIVHRDIKPGNVVLSKDGAVKILDFGIAKAGDAALTQSGTLLGTTAYMSPEQTGLGAVDARSDLWSLGVVLYEMLSGERPFRGDYHQAAIYSIRNDDPARIPGVSSALWSVVAKCLQKNPDDRYSSAEEVLEDLRGVHEETRSRPARRFLWPSILAAAVVVAVAGYWLRAPAGGPSSLPTMPADTAPVRIAILPVENLSPDPSDEYLAGGMTEELQIGMSGVAGVRLMARSSVDQLAAEGRSAAEVGRELESALVMEGSLRRQGDMIRVTLTLVDPNSGEHLWGESFDVADTNPLALESRISMRAAAAVAEELGREAVQTDVGTDSDEAYSLYLKGRHYWNKRSTDALWQAVDLFREALDIDPQFGRAWSGLADAYSVLGSLGSLPPEDAHPLARAAAERALEQDDDLAEAHTSLAGALSAYYWDWDLAEEHFRRAIALDPDYATAHQWYAEMLSHLGRHEEALEHSSFARQLDPLSASVQSNHAEILHLSGRHEQSAAMYDRLLATYPSHQRLKLHAGIAYLPLGRYREAIDLFESLRAVWGDSDILLGLLGYAHARAGDHAAALEMQSRLDSISVSRTVSPFNRAVLQVGTGDYESAIDNLEEAYRNRTWLMTLIKVEPIFDPLRTRARFTALVDSMGLVAERP